MVTLVGSTGTSLLEWVSLNVSPVVTLVGSTGTSLFEWVCLNVSPLVTLVGSTGTSLFEWVCLNVSPLVTLVGSTWDLRAAIRNFHLGPCKIEKSKIAKLCHNKGLPKPFIKICFSLFR